jgi:hypothetical protein
MQRPRRTGRWRIATQIACSTRAKRSQSSARVSVWCEVSSGRSVWPAPQQRFRRASRAVGALELAEDGVVRLHSDLRHHLGRWHADVLGQQAPGETRGRLFNKATVRTRETFDAGEVLLHELRATVSGSVSPRLRTHAVHERTVSVWPSARTTKATARTALPAREWYSRRWPSGRTCGC